MLDWGIWLLIYEVIIRAFDKDATLGAAKMKTVHGNFSVLLAGGIAGTVSWTTALPIGINTKKIKKKRKFSS